MVNDATSSKNTQLTHPASQLMNEVEIELRIARRIAKQSFDKRVTTVMIRIPIL